MKRYLACLLIAVLILIPVMHVQGASVNETCWCDEHLDGTKPYIPGDTNRDGLVTCADALEILRRCASGIPSAVPRYNSGEICPSTLVMDVNNNGYVEAKDALEVLKYVVGKIDGFDRQPVYYQPESPTDGK